MPQSKFSRGFRKAVRKWKKAGKNISYSLTDDGKRALRIAKEQFVKTFMGITA